MYTGHYNILSMYVQWRYQWRKAKISREQFSRSILVTSSCRTKMLRWCYEETAPVEFMLT